LKPLILILFPFYFITLIDIISYKSSNLRVFQYECGDISGWNRAFNGADSKYQCQYISKRLNDIGVNVYYHSVVGDNSVRLKKCLLAALERCDLVIMTGGLGPTQDDLTKETVAEVLGKSLFYTKKALRGLKLFLPG